MDLRHLDPTWLRRSALAIVPQDPVLFKGTVRDNSTYGLRDRDSEPAPAASSAAGRQPQGAVGQAEVEAVAKQIKLHDWVMSFPAGCALLLSFPPPSQLSFLCMRPVRTPPLECASLALPRASYDTQVGERGLQVSIAERQLIALARALLRNAPLLVLDDISSGLDLDDERNVQGAIERSMAGRTVLVISNRLTTIQMCDVAVVMGDGGRVVESGDFEEVARRPGSALASLVRKHRALDRENYGDVAAAA